MRSKLPKKKIQYNEWQLSKPDLIKKIERVLFFDPSKIYKRLGDQINPYKRHAGISMLQMFPPVEGKCACGCNKKPKVYSNKLGEEKTMKWASFTCQAVAGDVLSIINNYFGKPAQYITLYAGRKCSECGHDGYDLELDHIVGVKQGGGGCWLSNYRWLCHDCHVAKTNVTFGHKSKTAANKQQIKMELQ